MNLMHESISLDWDQDDTGLAGSMSWTEWVRQRVQTDIDMTEV